MVILDHKTDSPAVTKVLPRLCATGVSKFFGTTQVLANVDLAVAPGELHALIGPNGAGKSTLFNILTGLEKADSGVFAIDGQAYCPSSPEVAARAGVARTFQNIRLFRTLSVSENVKIGLHRLAQQGFWSALLRTKALRAEEAYLTEKTLAVLADLGISHYARARRTANHLSYGEQRCLEIARALVSDPVLLALDEPAAGMNRIEKHKLIEFLQRLLRERGARLSILLIEHDMEMINLAERVTVLRNGSVLVAGRPDDIKQHPDVIEAYLGKSE